MNIMNRVRIYHAVLAVLALLSFLTGEWGLIHAWLGYGVSLVIVLRLLWALSGERQVGLSKFYPSFEGLRMGHFFQHPAVSKVLMLSLALCLIIVSATGVAMDKGKAVGLANASLVAEAYADDDSANERHEQEESVWEELHEVAGNFMLVLVAAHAGYLLAFRRPLARFMLFRPRTSRG